MQVSQLRRMSTRKSRAQHLDPRPSGPKQLHPGFLRRDCRGLLGAKRNGETFARDVRETQGLRQALAWLEVSLCGRRAPRSPASCSLRDAPGAATKRADKLRAKGKEIDFKELLRMEPDRDVANIRNTSSKHWKRWLALEIRCVGPFTSSSEFNKQEGGDIWLALDETWPLAVFAGVWTRWTSVRKVRQGGTTNKLCAKRRGRSDPSAAANDSHPVGTATL